MNKLIIIAAVIIILLLGGYLLLGRPFVNKPFSPSVTTESSEETTKESPSFENPKKSAHFESNTPEHASTIAGVPINVVINFNFDLAAPSEIKIEKDGKDYGVGKTVIDDNKLSMRKDMDSNSPDGIYTVNYDACWPDKSCHDGNFQFAIDKNQSSSFENMTGQGQITIKMSQIRFLPMNIRIAKGTRVTWINDDETEHYVNTDSHPAHTYYPEQNSRVLKKGGSYSIVLKTSGIYPYHCSAHADSMMGFILVE